MTPLNLDVQDIPLPMSCPRPAPASPLSGAGRGGEVPLSTCHPLPPPEGPGPRRHNRHLTPLGIAAFSCTPRLREWHHCRPRCSALTPSHSEPPFLAHAISHVSAHPDSPSSEHGLKVTSHQAASLSPGPAQSLLLGPCFRPAHNPKAPFYLTARERKKKKKTRSCHSLFGIFQ